MDNERKMSADGHTAAELEIPTYPAGPQGLRLARLLLTHWNNPLTLWLRLAQEYGDIVHFRLGAKHFFFVRGPEAIKDVLVTKQNDYVKGVSYDFADRFWGNGLLSSEGEFHQQQRGLMQSAFHRSHFAHYADLMSQTADRTMQRWQSGATVDIEDEMRRTTSEIVCKALFTMDTRAADGIYRSVPPIVTFLEFSHLYALPHGRWLSFLRYRAFKRFKNALADLNRIIFSVIEARRRADTGRADLLSILLASDLDDKGIRDEIVTLSAAGHESSARALAWLWHLLSQHPAVEDQLYREVTEVLGDRSPTLDDLWRLPYTGAVVNETLRLYPPAFGIGRRALREVQVAGVNMPKGAFVVISPYVTHRDARFFHNPLQFNPNRWITGEVAGQPELAYFPFGAGLRRCIGEHFARTEMVLLAAAIARRWKLRTLPGQHLEPVGLFLLRPTSPIKMRLERRR